MAKFAAEAQESLLTSQIFVRRYVDTSNATNEKTAQEGFDHLQEVLSLLGEDSHSTDISAHISELKEQISIFRQSFSKLIAATKEQEVILASVLAPNAKKVRSSVDQMASVAFQSEEQLKSEVEATAAGAKKMLLIVGGLTLLVGFLSALVMSKSITKPMLGLVSTMNRLSEGDLTTSVPSQYRKDELGDMAKAVDFFRLSGIKAREMEEQQRETERKAEQEKRQMLMRLADDFDLHVGGIVENVSAASVELDKTAANMASFAEGTSQEASSASIASEQTSSSVQTVAAATEEMTITIGEINQQISQGFGMIQKAVAQVDDTTGQMQTLDETANKIGEVVQMISSIAEQTNLLALNATIESARAGEAGKGFAVVAGEVKELAGQTAKATDEIATQISDIQCATKKASGSMGDVAHVVQQVEAFSAAIATAMEEQNTATGVISESIHQAAQGTQQVNDNVRTVSETSQKTGEASNFVQMRASELATSADRLKTEVSGFIAQVRAS